MECLTFPYCEAFNADILFDCDLDIRMTLFDGQGDVYMAPPHGYYWDGDAPPPIQFSAEPPPQQEVAAVPMELEEFQQSPRPALRGRKRRGDPLYNPR